MTAEIGILNRHGIALAADSAVTVGSSKVFDSAEKLFALSKHHPVGIMVYGNADFMGVPWETVIKVFRKKLKDKHHDMRDGYISDFFEHLISDVRLYNLDFEEELIRRKFLWFLDEVLAHINDEIPNIFKTAPSEYNLRHILFAEAHYYSSKYNEEKTVEGFDDTYFDVFVKQYSQVIKDVIEDRVNFEIDLETAERFIIIGTCLVMKDLYINETGVVIAGFGDEEIFPRLISFQVEGIFNGVLKYKVNQVVQIDAVHAASIVPFAQQEMVHSFLTGIDPDLRNEIINFIEKVTIDYPNITNEHVIDLEDDHVQKMREIGKALSRHFKISLSSLMKEKFSDPVISTVASLPKEELAAMAEALINLTSIKRRMSTQKETVGGPVDVAIISKGDGFIWIKRKHYFSSELNHNYFKNYMER